MKKNSGFTLLEIIVGITIVSIALGTTFSLLATSKRLAFNAAYKIEQALFFRAAINLSQIQEEPIYPTYPQEHAENLNIETEEILESPPRQTQKSQLGLQPYILTDTQKGLNIYAIRLQKLETMQ